MKMDTKIMKWFYHMSWKRVAGIAMFMLAVAIIPVSLQVANSPTRTVSEAALLQPKEQEIATKFETPTGPPEIYLVDHFFGKVGDAVLIHGKNLGGVHPDSRVLLSGQIIEAENLIAWTGSYIEFKVPVEAKSGQVEVNILGKKTIWPGIFFVNNDDTQAELSLVETGEINQADLEASYINGGQELLIWLLIVGDEGDLNIQTYNGIKLSQKVSKLPVGTVYEVVIKIGKQTEIDSMVAPVKLLSVIKSDGQTVGIARGELSNIKGEIKPLTVNPLYVSY